MITIINGKKKYKIVNELYKNIVSETFVVGLILLGLVILIMLLLPSFFLGPGEYGIVMSFILIILVITLVGDVMYFLGFLGKLQEKIIFNGNEKKVISKENIIVFDEMKLFYAVNYRRATGGYRFLGFSGETAVVGVISDNDYLDFELKMSSFVELKDLIKDELGLSIRKVEKQDLVEMIR